MVHKTLIPPKELGCHRTGFARKCRDLVVGEECDMWRSHQVQEGSEIFTGFDCLDKWKAQFARDTVVGLDAVYKITESMRNEFMALAGYPNGHPEALPSGRVNGATMIGHEPAE